VPSFNNNGWATPLTEAEKIEATIGAFSARVEQLEEQLEVAQRRECGSWCDPGLGEHTSYCKAHRAALKASTNHERDGV
jgi:hypothetical protein